MDIKPPTTNSTPTTPPPATKVEEAIDRQKKMSKTSADASVLVRPIKILFKKFHVTIFIVITGGALFYAVVSLNNLVSQTSAGLSDNGSPNTSFNQNTITELHKHHTSATTSPSQTGSGRTNPFAE